MQLTADLSGLSPSLRNGVIKKLAHEDKARYDLGVLEQRRMKQLHEKMGVGAYKSDLGRAQFIMSQDQWQRCMAKYGNMIFMDPDFAPWLLRKNEDMRPADVASKIQVGYTGRETSPLLIPG